MSAKAISGLTQQQRELVSNIVVGGKPIEEAAALAGYHPRSVYRTIRLPAVAAAISESIQLDLQTTMAPLAYRVAKALLQDEQVSARVRADLAIKILDRAGHNIPSRADLLPHNRSISDMSRDELAAFIERNRAEIDKFDGELAMRAKEVSPTSPTEGPFLN